MDAHTFAMFVELLSTLTKRQMNTVTFLLEEGSAEIGVADVVEKQLQKPWRALAVDPGSFIDMATRMDSNDIAVSPARRRSIRSLGRR